jgi:DNA-binding LacI/PurR family transcriptional regulator
MKDVAEAAGVSRTTASFVLSGREAGIAPETQQRVRQVAHQLGYRPHAGAQALATGRTRRIGIVLNEPANFQRGDMYFAHVLAGITSGALRRDYNLLLHSAHYTDWQVLRDDILNGSADGVLLVGRYENDALTPALLDADFPTVCVSFHIDHPRCYAVDCDNELGGYLAVRHLIRLGHQQIAFFYPGESVSWGRERRLGAARALQEACLPLSCFQSFQWPETRIPDPEWTRAALAFLQTASPRPTALVCSEEKRVLRVMEALPEQGIRVPEDMAVISFNSTEISERSHPPMTSVWQPLDTIGEAAMEMLIDLLERREMPERIRRLPMRLDVRKSCGADRR